MRFRSGKRQPHHNAAPPPADRPVLPAAPDEPLIDLIDITKRFGAVLANDRISLSLHAGEVHALLGENGAGKTTLLNILSGMYQPDAGQMRIGGQPVAFASPADALRHGVGAVYQHFTLVPNLSIVENVILGMDRGFVLDLPTAERGLGELLTAFGLGASPRTEIRRLSLGERQRVEIIKALFRGSRTLLMDEPTSVLAPVEVDGLFALIRRLKSDGVAVVLITHKLEEALEVSDRITILRHGRTVAELSPAEIAGAARGATKDRVVELMFGTASREPRAASHQQSAISRRAPDNSTELLSLSGVTALGDRGAVAVRNLSLRLRAGEIVGIAGVDGNGQKELAEVIAGQRRVASGRIALRGRDLTNQGVAVAARAGIGYVTDDRLGEGAVPGASIAENVALKSIGRAPFSKRGFWLDRRALDAQARALIAQFDVRAPGPGARMTQLSGGNIQKLLLARELAMQPDVLVCNKPTYGLDLGAAQFVQRTLREQADAGNAVLLISSELDELLAVSDRIGVLFNGELVGLFDRAAADPETIGRLMLGGPAMRAPREAA